MHVIIRYESIRIVDFNKPPSTMAMSGAALLIYIPGISFWMSSRIRNKQNNTRIQASKVHIDFENAEPKSRKKRVEFQAET